MGFGPEPRGEHGAVCGRDHCPAQGLEGKDKSHASPCGPAGREDRRCPESLPQPLALLLLAARAPPGPASSCVHVASSPGLRKWLEVSSLGRFCSQVTARTEEDSAAFGTTRTLPGGGCPSPLGLGKDPVLHWFHPGPGGDLSFPRRLPWGGPSKWRETAKLNAPQMLLSPMSEEEHHRLGPGQVGKRGWVRTPAPCQAQGQALSPW